MKALQVLLRIETRTIFSRSLLLLRLVAFRISKNRSNRTLSLLAAQFISLKTETQLVKKRRPLLALNGNFSQHLSYFVCNSSITKNQGPVQQTQTTALKMAETTTTARTDLYPAIEPYDSGNLKVSDIHTLYYEQCGNKAGNPVVFLHGGPGGGTSPSDRTFFDPEAYRIVLFHQRGCGDSTPSAELRDNTTWHMVADIEKLRKHLGIDKWVVFGGSWGSTLALTYAQTHPDRVKALILRGIFTLRRSELEWFYEGKGAQNIYPDHWEKYIDFIPEVERGAIMDAYYRRLTSDDENVRIEAAQRWSTWEMATSHLIPDDEKIQKAEKEVKWALQFARIECHYFVNGGFFSSPSQILDNVDKIRHIPASIVQGRYDIVCPMRTAWQLHKRWPEAEFVIAATSGHNSREDKTKATLVSFCEKYKNL